MIKSEKGQAFVEAAILFPIMIMIFAGLIFLSFYLPTRAALQRATQYAATAIAVVESDTWIVFDEGAAEHRWETNKDSLRNVYAAFFTRTNDVESLAYEIVRQVESRNLSSKEGILTVESSIINHIIYEEITVSATRTFEIPIDLSFVRFPQEIAITVTSTAAVQNGDEFVRNVDMAVDFVKLIMERFGVTDISESINSSGTRVRSLLGW